MPIGPNPFDPSYQQGGGGTYQGTVAPNAGPAQRTDNTMGPGGLNDIKNGTQPMSGFAARYTPALADQAYQNPWYLLSDVFPGIDTMSPGYQALRDFGGDPLTLYNVMHGAWQSGKGTAEQGPQDFINFMADLYANMGKVGGRGFDANELLQNVFNQKTGQNANTVLGQILSAGDMSTQVRTLFNILRDISNVGMNPLAARGYQAAIASAGDRYGSQMMKTDAANTVGPVDWIRQNAPWLAG